MSEPQHPQAEGTQTGAGRLGAGGGVTPQPAPGATYAPLDSLAAVGARLAHFGKPGAGPWMTCRRA